jgi:hypothetical protein
VSDIQHLSSARSAPKPPYCSLLSRNVLPRQTFNHVVDNLSGDSELTGQGSTVSIFAGKLGSNLQYGLFRQLGLSVILSRYVRRLSSSVTPVFSNAVLRIIGICAQKQVIWSHTAGHVTHMKHPKTLRNFSERNSPANSVGFTYVSSHSEVPVPLYIPGARPHPTATRPVVIHLLDLIPESLHNYSIPHLRGAA